MAILFGRFSETAKRNPVCLDGVKADDEKDFLKIGF